MAKRRGLLMVLLIVVLAAWLIIAPPRFWLNLIKPVDLNNPVQTGAQLAIEYDCRKCHRIAGRGSLTASELTDVSKRLDNTALRLWLQNPRAIKSNTAMPNFQLSDSEIDALVAYLVSVSP